MINKILLIIDLNLFLKKNKSQEFNTILRIMIFPAILYYTVVIKISYFFYGL